MMVVGNERYKLKLYNYLVLVAFGVPTILLFFVYPYLYQVFYLFLFCFVVYSALMFTLGRMKRKPATPSDQIKYLRQLYNRSDKKTKAAGAFSWGLYCLEQKKYDKALAYFKESLELSPEEAYVKWDHIGFVAYHNKDYGSAIESYTKSIELNAEYSPVWSHLGDVYVELGSYTHAIQPFQNAYRLDPTDAHSWRGLVNCYINTEKLDEAEQICKHVLDIDSENDRGWYEIATVYFRKGDVERAIIALKKVIEINPKFAFAWYNLGLIYSHEGKLEEALKPYDTALGIDSGFEEAKRDRAILLRSNNISA